MKEGETKISFDILKETNNQLRIISAHLGISKAEFIRQSIQKSLSIYKTSEVIDELAKEQSTNDS